MKADENKELLEEEIKIEIGNLDSLQPGSTEHSAAVSSLEKLYKLKIDSDRVKMEAENSEREEQFKKEQLKSENRRNYIRTGVEIGGIVLPLVVYSIWTGVGFKFEESGVFTSKIFTNLHNRFKPKQ